MPRAFLKSVDGATTIGEASFWHYQRVVRCSDSWSRPGTSSTEYLHRAAFSACSEGWMRCVISSYSRRIPTTASCRLWRRPGRTRHQSHDQERKNQRNHLRLAKRAEPTEEPFPLSPSTLPLLSLCFGGSPGFRMVSLMTGRRCGSQRASGGRP